MTRRAPLAPHLTGAAFHVRDRDFHGASRGRLRASDVQRPFTAIRSIGLDPDDMASRCRAYEPLIRPGEAFSHATAAALFRLPLPDRDDRVHVLAPLGATRARGRGVVGHAASGAAPIVLHDGLPVVAPAHLWCQLANELSAYDLVAIGDAIVTRPRRGEVRTAALASLDELRDAAARWGARRGSRTIAAALPRIRAGAESPKETHLRLALVDAGLPEPVPNAPVRLPSRRVVHPDLAYLEQRIALEYLGDTHRTNRQRWQEDVPRRRDLAAAGWRVVEVTAEDLEANRAAFIEGGARPACASIRGVIQLAAGVAVVDSRPRHRVPFPSAASRGRRCTVPPCICDVSVSAVTIESRPLRRDAAPGRVAAASVAERHRRPLLTRLAGGSRRSRPTHTPRSQRSSLWHSSKL